MQSLAGHTVHAIMIVDIMCIQLNKSYTTDRAVVTKTWMIKLKSWWQTSTYSDFQILLIVVYSMQNMLMLE